MKILVIAPFGISNEQSGMMLRMQHLYRSLACKHDLTLACPVSANGGSQQLGGIFSALLTLPPFQVVWPLENPVKRLLSAFLSRIHQYELRNLLLLDPIFKVGWLAPVNQALRRQLTKIVEDGRFDAIIVENEALQTLAGLRIWGSHPLVLNSQNVLSALLKTQAGRNKATTWTRLHELKVSCYYETHLCRRFDHIIAVSEADQRRWQQRLPNRSVGIVPNGVDTNHFAPTSTPAGPPNLVFVGGADYTPNRDAMEELVNEVFPIVRSQVPSAILTLIGKDAPRRLEQPGVHVLGYVEEIKPLLDEATMMVAPIRSGGGTRIKILTAMSMAKTVVTTNLGAEGLDVQDGYDIVLCDSPREIAQSILTLIQNPQCSEFIGRNARHNVVEKYDWQLIGNEFERQIAAVVGRKRR